MAIKKPTRRSPLIQHADLEDLWLLLRHAQLRQEIAEIDLQRYSRDGMAHMVKFTKVELREARTAENRVERELFRRMGKDESCVKCGSTIRGLLEEEIAFWETQLPDNADLLHGGVCAAGHLQYPAKAAAAKAGGR
jgi:hypothetical protein